MEVKDSLDNALVTGVLLMLVLLCNGVERVESNTMFQHSLESVLIVIVYSPLTLVSQLVPYQLIVSDQHWHILEELVLLFPGRLPRRRRLTCVPLYHCQFL